MITLFRFDTYTPHGYNCNDGSGTTILFDGKIVKDQFSGDNIGISNCNIIIDEIQKVHNGTWTCLVSTTTTFSDTVNITIKGAIVGRLVKLLTSNMSCVWSWVMSFYLNILDEDVVLSAGTIMAITIPIALLFIICAILALIWCFCPMWIALCCCCIPACREKRDSVYKETHYTQTPRDKRRRSSTPSDTTSPPLPPIPARSIR